jgi:hypothetical protein
VCDQNRRIGRLLFVVCESKKGMNEGRQEEEEVLRKESNSKETN